MQKKKSRASKTRTRSKILLASALVGIVIFGAPVATYADTAETEAETDAETDAPYTEDELYLLSHLIAGECEGCSETMKINVGSVALNRVTDSRFPGTLREVIYQPGQYSCTWDGNFEKEPSEETVEVTKDLLTDGSQLPPDVIFQAEFVQGVGVYTSELAPNGVTMYFCRG